MGRRLGRLERLEILWQRRGPTLAPHGFAAAAARMPMEVRHELDALLARVEAGVALSRAEQDRLRELASAVGL